MVARNYGARDYDGVHGAVHTSVLTALIGGVFLIFVGIALARPLLELMGTPDNVIDQSVLYMRIYFVGMPSFMLYNFGSAILRAIGDTKRPLYFLTLAGVINVFLNLFFVIVFHMGRCGRRAGDHHFPDRFGDSGSAVPDEDGGPLPSGL